MNQADNGHNVEPRRTSLSEVIGAWIVLALLLIGTCLSFALDHMVTVSDGPDWSSLAPVAGRQPADEGPGGQVREIRDDDRR